MISGEILMMIPLPLDKSLCSLNKRLTRVGAARELEREQLVGAVQPALVQAEALLEAREHHLVLAVEQRRLLAVRTLRRRQGEGEGEV